MSESTLNIETRKETGKQYAKLLKREGKIPGIFYFHGKETIPFSAKMKDVQLIQKETGLITVKIDNKQEKKCVVRNVQFDPIRMEPIHIDLMGILLTEKITITVPVHVTGEAEGVKLGGTLQHVLREVEVECFPNEIPENLHVDISSMQIGDAFHVSDLKTENVRFLAEDDAVIVTISAPRKEAETVEGEEGMEPTEPEVISRDENEE